MENEFDKIEQLLYSEAKKIQPPAEGLRLILNKINSPVTEKNVDRLNTQEAYKGRAWQNNLLEHLNNTMNSFWKVAVPIGLVVVVVAAIGYWRFSASPAAQNMAIESEFASQEVAQSVDEIINETIDDEELLSADAEDASLGDYDEQALVAFDSVTSVYEQ